MLNAALPNRCGRVVILGLRGEHMQRRKFITLLGGAAALARANEARG
jgi:hypothetical protein